MGAAQADDHVIAKRGDHVRVTEPTSSSTIEVDRVADAEGDRELSDIDGCDGIRLGSKYLAYPFGCIALEEASHQL
jgi:hypothetical protein